ncbi:MAG: hypothetical protein WCH98_04320 [Verrucomicrobiota bacterium]
MKALWFLCLFLAGCGLAPQRVSISAPEIQTLFSAAQEFPRTQHGFSSLPVDAGTDIRIERHSHGAYDVMLHIYNDTSRTIAFRRSVGGFKWIHEQEVFRGPRFYDSPDGRLQEQIVLTYETEPISGAPKDQLQIDYFGDDVRFPRSGSLSLSDVRPILAEWGYKQ